MTFYGGKMMHIFTTDKDDGDDSKNGYSKSFRSEGMLDVLNSGTWYVKIDGGNGLLIFNEESNRYDLYRRYDNKSKPNENKKTVPLGAIELPESKNMNIYESETLHHHYYQVYVPRKEILKTKDDKMFNSMYSQIDAAFANGRFNDSNGVPMKFVSIEFVGPNFSRTPQVPETTIAIHHEQIFQKPSEEFKNVIEAYDYFENLFENQVMEGIVVKSPDGTYYKVLSAHFKRLGKCVSKWKCVSGFETLVLPPITLSSQ